MGKKTPNKPSDKRGKPSSSAYAPTNPDTYEAEWRARGFCKVGY